MEPWIINIPLHICIELSTALRFQISSLRLYFLSLFLLPILYWSGKSEGRNHTSYWNAAAAATKSRQSCLTLCDPIDGSPPGSSVPGILQARILEWVAISFSNACMHSKSLQSCLTLCNPMDSSPPGSSVHRILQARVLEWVAISFSLHIICKSVWVIGGLYTKQTNKQ